MDYHRIKYLKETDPTIKILNADNSPLIISFLFQAFKQNSRNTIPNDELVSNLSDFLFSLRETYGNDIYPDSAQNYLEKWANDNFLRRFYQTDNDEPNFELTPSSEKVLDWLKSLEKREFVGTESRLIKIIEILKEIAYKVSDDPTKRLIELEKQKAEIEEEINKINLGIPDKLSNTQIKERYFEVYDTANRLLSDFKQIEYNFRHLDQEIREKQIKQDIQKGKLLKEIFFSHDELLDSDQGKSFKAFWELLMYQSKQDELNILIDTIVNIPEIKEIKKDDFLEGLKNNLIDAGYRVNITNHILIEQLRKYLDDRAYLENKKIMEIIKEIKTFALQIKDKPPGKDFFEIDNRAKIEMIMERPFWDVLAGSELMKIDLEDGLASNVDVQVLYSQFNVNREELEDHISSLLQHNSQITLKTLLEHYPIERGLAEILTYLDIAVKKKNTVINEDIIETMVLWNKSTNKQYKVHLPQIILCGG